MDRIRNHMLLVFRPSLALTLLLGILSLASPTGADAAVRALVIGIDRYTRIPELQGAVADARDLGMTLSSAGVEVATLVDAQVTRRAILDTWQELIAKSETDDVLILTFAGHGIQVADDGGDEADGFDEAFVLPDFEVGRSDDASLLVDDAIDQLIRKAAPRPVVMVADTCHSGTLARARDDRIPSQRSRFIPRSAYGGFADDPFPPFPPSVREATPPPSNLVFFGAVPEMLVVQEVLIDGTPRGALSYAFARAIEGQGDRDGDGIIRLSELQAQVPELVRVITETRQTPQIVSRLARDLTVVASEENAGEVDPPIAPPTLEPLRIALDGPAAESGRGILRRVSGILEVERPQEADLIWHLPSGDVLTRFGDVAARLGLGREPALLQGVVNKWRLLGALDRQIDGSLTARVRPDDRLFRSEEVLTVELQARLGGELLLFDLASDGTVLDLQREGAVPLAAGEGLETRLRAGPPFGSDHLLAALFEGGSGAARRLINRYHGRPLDGDALTALKASLKAARVLPISIYTAP